MAMCTGDRFKMKIVSSIFAIQDKEKFEGLIFWFSFKYSVNAQMRTVRFYGEPCALKFARSHQTISSVANFHRL